MNNKELGKKAKSKGLGKAVSDEKAFHVLLCTGPNCQPDIGKETVKRVNKEGKKLREDGISVFVTETKCFRLCRLGPLAAVYPDGVWYSGVTPENAGRICETHLKNGEIVADLAFLVDPLDAKNAQTGKLPARREIDAQSQISKIEKVNRKMNWRIE